MTSHRSRNCRQPPGGSPMRKDVEFSSEGTTVPRSSLHPGGSRRRSLPPRRDGRGMAVVKELVQPGIREAFDSVGCAALVFDYRGSVASEGTPLSAPRSVGSDRGLQERHHSPRPSAVPTRAHRRLGHLVQRRPCLVVGATDPWVRCVVSTIPVVDGLINMRWCTERSASVA